MMRIKTLILICPLLMAGRMAKAEEKSPVATTTVSATSTTASTNLEATKSVAKSKSADAICVKKQITTVLDYEKKFYSSKNRFTDSASEASVPKEVIADCPGWSDPAIRTTYGGSGVVIKSTNPTTGETWSINNEGTFVQESQPNSH